MKALSTLLALLLSGNGCFAERVIFTGFDLSGTAWRGEGNPYDNGLKEVLSTVEGGDHVYGAVINERGLANGAPVIDFGIRPYSFWSDKRNEYEPAVQTKLKMQREALNNVLKSSTPSKKTEIIGFLHSAAQILNGYPAKTVKQIVIWTDGLQEGDEVDLARIVITDEQISKIIETERGAGRLPKLNGVAIWFVTSPSVESTQFTTSKLLRLEAFWRKYLQACGADLKAFSPVLVNFGGHMAMGSDAPSLRRSKSPPFNKGATMHIWPEEMELLRLNSAGDSLTLKDTFNGSIITGEKGCGKTSGSAAHLHACFLAIGAGGFVFCPKRTDARDYGRLFTRWSRDGDVITMRPAHEWTEEPINSINILEAEQKLFGHGNASATNVTTLLMKVSDLVQRQSGPGATKEAFWREYARTINHAGLTGQSEVSNKFDLKLLLKFVNELPNSLAETEDNSLYSVALMREAKAKLGDSAPYDFMLAYNFVMREWPLSPPNARSSGALTVQVMLSSLLSHPLRQLLFEKTTFDLDRVLNHGGILLLDMNVDDYPQAGIAGMILKDIISRAAQVRPQLGSVEPQFVQPVYLLVDEYPEYAIDADEKHARMARSARPRPDLHLPVNFIAQGSVSRQGKSAELARSCRIALGAPERVI